MFSRVDQSMKNWCKWIEYSLLDSLKWLHVSRTVRRPSHRSICTLAILETNVPDFSEPSNWPSNSSVLNPWIIQFGLLFSSWSAKQFKSIDHLKQVRNSRWDMINQELLNGAIHWWSKWLLLRWTFIRWMDALNVVSVDSVIFGSQVQFKFKFKNL